MERLALLIVMLAGCGLLTVRGPRPDGRACDTSARLPVAADVMLGVIAALVGIAGASATDLTANERAIAIAGGAIGVVATTTSVVIATNRARDCREARDE